MKVGDLVKIKGNPRTLGIPKNSIGLIVKYHLVRYDDVYHLYEVQVCGSGRQIRKFGEDLEVLTKKSK